MDNQTAIGLLSLCGIVAVLILLGSFLLMRIMKSSVFGIANLVLKSVTDPTEVKSSPSVRSQSVPRRDFRAEAKSVDFDAAVASHKGEVNPSIRTTPASPTPELRASAFSAPDVSAPSSRKHRRQRNTNIEDEEDGEMFEGLMGD